MGEFRMPSMGADMEAATLVEWTVEPGDAVQRGDIIAEIETEKGNIDVEVFEDGVVDELLVEPGEKLPVGTVLARIRREKDDEEAPAEAVTSKTEGTEPAHAGDGESTAPRLPEKSPTVPPRRHVRASPLARRVAADLGVDLSKVTGSGPQGAIQRIDVERAAQALAPPEMPPEKEPPEEAPKEESPAEEAPTEEAPTTEAEAPYPERMRQAIAKAMARSNREIPHYFLETPISMQRALQWLESENEERSVKERLLPVVLLFRAVIRALDDVPALNGYWRNDRHEPQEAIHLGVAISLRQGGLVIPAIRNADQKSVDELMQALDDLITRARSGRLRSSELTEATITVTNLGDLGVETVHGMIYPPQVALVGFGKITERPWAEDGMLGVRPVVTATLAGDHRATDGRQGAKFLDAINEHLQRPDEL